MTRCQQFENGFGFRGVVPYQLHYLFIFRDKRGDFVSYRRPYRYLATSLRGFIQQLSVYYVRWGYYFYVVGRIPEKKDPTKTDRKILEKYGLCRSRWSNARAKEQGKAAVHYLRFDRTFVIVATHGEHVLRQEEDLKDLRQEPIKVFGYAIGYHKRIGERCGHVSVRIQKPIYLEIKARLSEKATKRSVAELMEEFSRVPFAAYSGVRSQMLNILREVNRRRVSAGLESLPLDTVQTRRRSVKVFEESDHVVIGSMEPDCLDGAGE